MAWELLNPTQPGTYEQGIIDGRAFGFSETVVLGIGATRDYLLEVGAAKVLAAIVNVISDGAADLEIFEDPTEAGGDPVHGTAKVPFDINRTTDNTFSGTLSEGPTNDVDGVSRGTSHIPAGGKNSQIGGEAEGNGTLLKLTSFYLVRITNSSGANNKTTISFRFLEES